MPDLTRCPIPYGDASVSFDVPSANLMGVYAPHDVAPLPDLDAALSEALSHPIGGPSLEDMVRGARSVLLVVDDNTRPTPTDRLLPPLLDRLNAAGIPDEAIELLIALGTHRPMTWEECEQKFGLEVMRRIAVRNHDAFCAEQLVALGVTPGGVHVTVNRAVMDADCVIGVGSIVPHHIPGYSGGAKIIQPGVCGEHTTGEVHLLSTRHEQSLLGQTENVVRHEMEAIADQAGLNAILNTVLDAAGEVVGLVFGEPRQAFRRGAALSKSVYGVDLPTLADIVVAGSHPCDIEFWQAHKTLYAGARCLRTGGTLIVVTPCPEGLSVTHPDIVEYAGDSPEAIEAGIASGAIHDLTAGALALAWANVRGQVRISLVSDGIDDETARAIGFRPFPDVQTALDAALAEQEALARVAVLPYAPDALPLVEQAE